MHRLSNTAYKNKVALIVGVRREDDAKLYNSAYIFSPTGEVLLKDDGWSHGRVAIMKGVEGNYAVARAGQWGD
ncbi:MAG: Nitrilase/cyanide hydratase and apolipoprotein N-acyltransferase [Firmicutes bacterium]|nr:Nitrilase/cyanide hydratase and apolipoprotein N-acyltransferase [Bacillota bacterium]